ncbi:MAG TPA: hypothetical protein VEI51_00610 [Methanomicrobiales archaeon]|nr:hypothetical protein [Methanomicrobiales archaeon]
MALNSLIQELAEVKYTGDVTVSRGREVITLVIQKGRYILAEFGPLKGGPAWEAINALGEANIDAILADFTDAEMKLALEFNGEALLSSPIITRVFRPPRERPRPAPARARPAEPQPVAAVPLPAAPPATSPAPAEPETAPVLAVPLPSPEAWTRPDLAQASAEVPATGGGEGPSDDGYDELALLHMEMSALDDVDVEHIATKIRKNAKGIVKKLHLGHLMTEKEE